MVAVESAQHHGPLRRDANNIADMIEPVSDDGRYKSIAALAC
jgi:hypothetical protein